MKRKFGETTINQNGDERSFNKMIEIIQLNKEQFQNNRPNIELNVQLDKIQDKPTLVKRLNLWLLQNDYISYQLKDIDILTKKIVLEKLYFLPDKFRKDGIVRTYEKSFYEQYVAVIKNNLQNKFVDLITKINQLEYFKTEFGIILDVADFMNIQQKLSFLTPNIWKDIRNKYYKQEEWFTTFKEHRQYVLNLLYIINILKYIQFNTNMIVEDLFNTHRSFNYLNFVNQKQYNKVVLWYNTKKYNKKTEDFLFNVLFKLIEYNPQLLCSALNEDVSISLIKDFNITDAKQTDKESYETFKFSNKDFFESVKKTRDLFIEKFPTKVPFVDKYAKIISNNLDYTIFTLNDVPKLKEKIKQITKDCIANKKKFIYVPVSLYFYGKNLQTTEAHSNSVLIDIPGRKVYVIEPHISNDKWDEIVPAMIMLIFIYFVDFELITLKKLCPNLQMQQDDILCTTWSILLSYVILISGNDPDLQKQNLINLSKNRKENLLELLYFIKLKLDQDNVSYNLELKDVVGEDYNIESDFNQLSTEEIKMVVQELINFMKNQ